MRLLKNILICGIILQLVITNLNAKAEQESDDFEDMDESSKDDDEESDVNKDIVNDIDEEDIKSETTLKEKVIFNPPEIKGFYNFFDYFEKPYNLESSEGNWHLAKASKSDGETRYDGIWSVEEAKSSMVKNDLSLVLKSRAKHHAISHQLDKPFHFKKKPLIVQYEVKFQEGQECGGGYIKLLSESNSLDLKKFNDATPYTIMFGPDKCGNDFKLHFIYRFENPKTKIFEEKHAKKPSGNIESYFTDKLTHLYTLIVQPDNTYKIYVDQYEINSGSLITDVIPTLNPDKEIPDENDKKPEDWDERERIPDPKATKPEDWDENEPELIDDSKAVKPSDWLDSEPSLIPDPKAEKPSDWDEEMDGEWEAPLINNPKCESVSGCGEWKKPEISNPNYKGKWTPPLIDNPQYKGKWSPRMIENPDYFHEEDPFTKLQSISAIGLELWSMSNDISFDNILISSDKSLANQLASDLFLYKKNAETISSTSSVINSLLDATHERPWLWAVMIFVIILPLVLIFAYCCFNSPKTSDKKHPKKTDELTADDEGEDDEEDGEPEEEEGMEGAGESVARNIKKNYNENKETEEIEELGGGEEEEEEEEEGGEGEAEVGGDIQIGEPIGNKKKNKVREDGGEGKNKEPEVEDIPASIEDYDSGDKKVKRRTKTDLETKN